MRAIFTSRIFMCVLNEKGLDIGNQLLGLFLLIESYKMHLFLFYLLTIAGLNYRVQDV